MNEFLGSLYFIVGGLVAGRAAYDGWQTWSNDRNEGEEFPFIGALLITLLIWLAWPVVVGIYWAARKDRLANAEKTAASPKESGG